MSKRLRSTIAAGVTNLTSGGGGPKLDYSSPAGDPGLFGPEAICWKVHADFTSMMTGGVSALLLQALHPVALAGVWDHSTFRTDILGRLRRTATFVAGTTYGNRRDALALIERVKSIHLGVTGIAPDGQPYRASDPDLLTWVHVAEVSSFLKAYLRYGSASLSADEQDRYYAETSRIARHARRTRRAGELRRNRGVSERDASAIAGERARAGSGADPDERAGCRTSR